MNFLITGVASGLGAAICKIIRWHAPVGHYVIGIDKKLPYPVKVDRMIIFDLADEIRADDINCTVPIHVLINCAAEHHLSFIEETDIRDWDRIMKVNARAPFLLAKALLPNLTMSGSIINICSDASTRPMTASLAYCASKAALEQMTRVMAREWKRRYNINVFAVSPAKIDGTRMSAEVDQRVCDVRGWTPENAETYHRANVLMKTDIPVEKLATFIYNLIQHREHLSGCIIPYGG